MKKIFLLFLLASSSACFAQEVSGLSSNALIDTIRETMIPVMDQLTVVAIKWLAVFAVLQFVISNYKIILGENDITAVLAKLVFSLIWIGVCLWIIENGPELIAKVGDQFFGSIGEMPQPSSILENTIKLSAFLGAVSVVTSATVGIGDTIGLYGTILSIIVGLVGIYFAAKIFMLQLELGMIVLLSPLSFAFLGLNALRDQGLAPFKSLLALGYRIILVLVIVVAFEKIGLGLHEAIKQINMANMIKDGFQKIMTPIVQYIGAYGVLTFILFKSDSIASSLASGTVSSGASDMSAAVAAGAAAGALASGGASALAGAVAKPQNTMADFMANMAGGGGTPTSMSSLGIGGGLPPPPPASMSMSGTVPSFGSSTGPSSSFGTGTGTGTGTGKYANMPVPSQPVAASDLASPRFGAEPGQANSSSPSGAPSQESKQGAFDPKTARPATAGDATAAAKPSYSSSSSGQSAKPSAPAPAAQSPFPAYTGPQEAKPADFDPKTARPADFGSASTASIGGAPQQGGGDIDKRLDGIQAQLEKRGQAGLGQQFNELDRRLGQDHATTSVSINSHHVD